MAEAHSTCAHCGEQFSNNDKRKIYCCKKCKVDAWKASNSERYSALVKASKERNKILNKKPEYTRVSSGYCVRCGSPYCGQNKNKHCSADCLNATSREKYSKYKDCDTKNCKLCGVVFVPSRTMGRKTDYCSIECKVKAYDAFKKKGSRVGKAKRRALCKGADAESVNPFTVFDRDGWKCKLCGVKTPRRKRGTYDDDAPELDHIIPLSKGGSHTYKNTQCSCRKCNLTKRDRPMGQMLLIG